MKKLSVSAAKQGLTCTNPVRLGHAIRRLARAGYDSDGMYRLALAADPQLSRSTWTDRYLEAFKAVSPFGQKASMGPILDRGSPMTAAKVAQRFVWEKTAMAPITTAPLYAHLQGVTVDIWRQTIRQADLTAAGAEKGPKRKGSDF